MTFNFRDEKSKKIGNFQFQDITSFPKVEDKNPKVEGKKSKVKNIMGHF